ncbi:MAG: TolC family protein [Myxococcota bacterium]|jgi:outer membrane protein TolC|nr:TolC family protein [Myxococcota bacterium]
MRIAKGFGVALASFTLAYASTAAVAVAVAVAETDGSTEVATETAGPADDRVEATAESTSLSLRDAVDLALENNLGVEIERHAPLIAEQDLSVAWSAYDPTVTGSLSYASQRGAKGVSSFDPEGTEVKTTNGSVGMSGLVPWVGATLSLDYTGSKTTGGTPTTSLDPSYESGLAVAASIPLLRGLVWNDPWTQVRIANVGRSVAHENFRAVVMDTVDSSVSAYWNLVAAQEQLRVAKKSLETGRALLDQTSTQYEVGVKSRVEVIQAEAGVAARELDVIRADATHHNAQDVLVDAVYGTRLTATSDINIAPTDLPADFAEYEVDPVIATEQAIKNRPERASLELDIERQETLVRFRKNQRLPELNLNAAYGTSGVAGDVNPDAFVLPGSDPPDPDGDQLSDTPDNWFKRRGAREYSVGGVISIPLGNYGPRHSVSKARLELRQAQTRLKHLDQKIILEVRQGIRALEAARKGIDASERQRIAAEEQLRAERIRLEHGESTPFDVLQKESDLVEAESAKIEALQLYRTSASTLDRAQGTILRNHNIVVGSVAELRNGVEPETFGVRDLLEPVLP